LKISSKNILKTLRLYDIADEQTSVNDIKKLEVESSGFYVKTSFVFKKRQYVLFFGASIDSDIENIWPDKPVTAKPIANPLDSNSIFVPFHGKLIALYELKPQKQRLDVFLSTSFDRAISRSLWQKYIKLGSVKVNGKKVTTSKFEVDETDDIQVDFPEKIQTTNSLPIIFEDADVIVVDKPVGMLTHAKGGLVQEETVADFLRPKTSFDTDSNRPGIIHRLDRQTSGILIGARHEMSAKFIQKQFTNRTVEKTYIAVVEGQPKLKQARIDLPIARNPKKPSTFRVDANGKSAETIYKVLATKNNQSLVLLEPITGRTHQLRVHLAHLGTPIVGDAVYGKAEERMYLHAYSLELLLPSGNRQKFVAPPPKDFLKNFSGVKLP